jgi:glycosyltransferase involved in cell wall biosynthesis
MNLKKTNSRYRVVIGATYWTLTGVNIFSANLARSLNDLGVPAHVLLTEQKTRLVEIFDPVMEFPDDVPFSYLPVQPRDSWGAHWGALIRYLEQLAPCVYIPNADWRHSNVSSLLSDRVAIVGVVHSDDPMHYDHVHRLGDYWNAIVTVSKTVAEKTSAANPKWANKVSTIPIGVNVPAIYPERNLARDRPIKIIYHGLLNQWQKRILDLPKILEELRNRKVPAYLTIAGGGHDELKLRQEFRRLDLLSQVEFLGVVPHSRMLEILQSQDVFILTSEFEGMPNALLESMARGCVPVVTGVRSGIPEIVKDGQNGYIIPVGDISFFVDRLSELQKDDDTRVRLSREAHRTVQGNAYNSASMAASYKDF